MYGQCAKCEGQRRAETQMFWENDLTDSSTAGAPVSGDDSIRRYLIAPHTSSRWAHRLNEAARWVSMLY